MKAASSLAPFGALSFAYFASIGLFNPYAPLWFASLGFSTLAIGAIALPLLATGLPDGPGRLLMLGALLVALAAELIERYLFFVSVVPKHLAAPYIASASEAA